nr:PREDICTED: uncharacterized protein LOC105671586 [Linepithema humile]
MNLDALRDFQMPYLQAIQTIPGNTASEKQQWIGKSASHELHVTQDLKQLSLEAISILLLEVAVKHRRHEDITLALRSDDWTIVNRALKATWFFNGSQEIIDAEYFSKRVFPYISRLTKTRVVCTLASCIKNPSFAEAIFNALTITYNVETALPLLMICDQEFIYATIVEKKLILPVHIFKKIYYKNPEFGVRLLKEYIGHHKMYRFCNRQRSLNISARNSPQNIIQEYQCILHTLAKKRSMEFVNIVQNVIQTVNLCDKIGVLSKKCAKKFLKKAKTAVIGYPHFYMPMLPSQLINAELLEMMFPGLMKYYCRHFFCTDKMLKYLKDYPEDKRLEILFETYRDLYQHELLDKVENVTPALLKILPIEKRIMFTQNMVIYNLFNNLRSYEKSPLCYLSVDKAIPIFKRLMRSVRTQLSTLDLILKMIYTCKVNNDEDELYNVLSYIIDGEYIISDYITLEEALEAMHQIFVVCEVPFVNERNGSLLCHMIRLFYTQYNHTIKRLIMDMLHFRFIKNMPIADLIDMLIGVKDTYYFIKFNMFKYNAQYEKRWLIFFIERNIKIYKRWQPVRDEEGGYLDVDLKYSALCQLLMAISDFNERCNNSRTRMERIAIENYPDLINAIDSLIVFAANTIYWKKVKKVLHRNESDLHRRLSRMPYRSRNMIHVASREALRELNNNFQSILDNWEEYLTNCRNDYCDKHVQRFVRATRWYKDIPIKFAERCVSDLQGEDTEEMSSALIILSLLLHGNSLTQLLDLPFIKEKSRTDIVNIVNTYYNLSFSYVLSIMISNPPVPLRLITEVFECHSAIQIMILSRVIPRLPVLNVMSYFTNNVSSMSVKRRMWWIHLMCLIVPISEQIIFLYEMWTTEKHSWVEVTLYGVMWMLCDDPYRENALLLQQTKASFFVENVDLVVSFQKFASDFVDHPYVWNFFDIWLEFIAIYGEMGYVVEFIEKCTTVCLCFLNPFFFKCNDNFDISYVLQKFLCHANYGISKAMQDHALPYILRMDEICFSVINNVLPNILSSLQSNLDQSPEHVGRSSAIRHNVYLFLEKFVVAYKLSSCSNYGAVIKNLLKMFAEESLIKQNMQSYALLKYAWIMYISDRRCVVLCGRHFTEDSNELFFGQQLGRRMLSLVEMFSPQSLDMLAKVLVRFLVQLYKDDNYLRVISCVTRDLLIVSNKHSWDMVKMILAETPWK